MPFTCKFSYVIPPACGRHLKVKDRKRGKNERERERGQGMDEKLRRKEATVEKRKEK